MALVKCGECGNRTADDARRCPACGAATASWRRSRRTLWIAVGILVIVLYVVGMAYKSHHDAERHTDDFLTCIQRGGTVDTC